MPDIVDWEKYQFLFLRSLLCSPSRKKYKISSAGRFVCRSFYAAKYRECLSIGARSGLSKVSAFSEKHFIISIGKAGNLHEKGEFFVNKLKWIGK